MGLLLVQCAVECKRVYDCTPTYIYTFIRYVSAFKTDVHHKNKCSRGIYFILKVLFFVIDSNRPKKYIYIVNKYAFYCNVNDKNMFASCPLFGSGDKTSTTSQATSRASLYAPSSMSPQASSIIWRGALMGLAIVYLPTPR